MALSRKKRPIEALADKLKREHARLEREVARFGPVMEELGGSEENLPVQFDPVQRLGEPERGVPPEWLGKQAGRYGATLEAHYRYYMRMGQVDKATSTLVFLTKMAITIAVRHNMYRAGLKGAEEAEVVDEAEVAAMSDDELEQATKEAE